MNSADSGNHWLVLELIGRYSNRDTIGAKVKLTTASGRVLHNQVSVSVGFISSSDKRVHFGLGAEKQIRSIEIRWPRGAVQKLTNVAADRFVKIDELKALIASARNSRFWCSVIANFLDSPRSTCLMPGPRSVLTAQLPNLVGAGSRIVVGSNQM